MPEVRLGRQEAETEALPPVCMCCGQSAVVHRPQRLTWKPSWVSAVLGLPVLLALLGFSATPGDVTWGVLLLIGGLAVYIVVQRRVQREAVIRAPLCATHQYHWLWRAVALPLGFVFLLAMCCTGGAVIDVAERRSSAGLLQALFSMVIWGLGLIWFAVVIVAEYTVIQLKGIDDHSLTLAGVSQRFADAVNRQHQERRPDDRPQPPDGGQFFDPQAR